MNTNVRTVGFWLSLGLVFILGLMSLKAQAVTQDDPGKMVQELSELLIVKVDENREKLQSSTEEVVKFAEEYVLPYVAQEKMARFVMGIHWRSASDKQRQEFIEAFTKNLIRSYSSNFLKLEVVSASVDQVKEPKPRRAEVTSTITMKDGQVVEVIYRAFQDKESKKWLLYDFTFNNISTLVSFRNVYGAMIDQKGVDAVIDELKKNDSTPIQSEPAVN
ncbi:MlaC/ttg2D family ABC transporter substrate-binding protein [Thiomicrorhabdus xiamenensis]|uniref:ABC transporter substrate-binding protein n=1 Tax=Thiomicrorhabdus xiamenensis TaxID=2739063 RepID=A0A7D4SNS5_9GAMM|nr:ABC transporter substrate-binding protein [Thiomicrorhabdus xiamenensis]QKI89741.1 ABC transporter substrate-binding protein [Thiomicrorhabdus xiamenensis]